MQPLKCDINVLMFVALIAGIIVDVPFYEDCEVLSIRKVYAVNGR